MIRQFEIGRHVYFRFTTHAKASASNTGTTVIINQGAEGIVTGYSKEGTEENTSDDLVEVKITEGNEEEKGKVVWVPFKEFSNLSKQ